MTRHDDLRTRWMTTLTVAGLALLLLAPAPAQAGQNLSAADPLPAKEAQARLKQAAKVLRDKKRATGDELRSALEELADAHARAGGTAREQSTFRRKAEAQLLKGLALYKAGRRAPDENLRADVNILAAELLGKTAPVLNDKERQLLSAKIRTVLQKIAKDRKPIQWQQEPLDAAYAALAALNDPGTLRWMLEEHSHSKEREIPFLMAAHRAMLKFKDVPGKLRHDICKRMIIAYSAVESVARTASSAVKDRAKKRFWDQMREYVIPVLQVYCGKPENAEGEALSTVHEFDRWFDDHDNKRKAPWKDG